jgi:hypothetical protein
VKFTPIGIRMTAAGSMQLLENIRLFPEIYGGWSLGSAAVMRELACLKSAPAF